jgi:phosphoesterase RecJ-like protein
MKEKLKRIEEALARSRRIVITTHVSPDGDGLSAELALNRFLQKAGREVAVVNRDPAPEIYAFLPGADEILISDRLPAGTDLVFVTDCGGLDRTGLEVNGDTSPTVVVIDHHLTNDHSGEINFLDVNASATGELVYFLLREMENHGEGKIDYPIALCLYTSIFTDTGSFRYSNTTPQALSIASELLAYGVNSWMVAEHVYESKSFPVLQLTGRFLSTLRISRKGRFAWGHIRQADLRETGTRDEHTDGFVNFPRSIRGVEVAVLFREINTDSVKISMRSKGKVNVAAIAEKFGGGGHHNAAGCVLSGSLEEVKRRVLGIVGESLEDERISE